MESITAKVSLPSTKNRKKVSKRGLAQPYKHLAGKCKIVSLIPGYSPAPPQKKWRERKKKKKRVQMDMISLPLKKPAPEMPGTKPPQHRMPHPGLAHPPVPTVFPPRPEHSGQPSLGLNECAIHSASVPGNWCMYLSHPPFLCFLFCPLMPRVTFLDPLHI